MGYLLAANPVTGLRDPTLETLYPILIALAGLLFFMFFWWVVRRLRDRGKARRSSWTTFEKIAKTRKLTPLETRTLAALIKGAKIKRPTQVMGSIQLFDQCVEQVVAVAGLSEGQQAILGVVRRKLMATVVKWDGRERRNLQRVPCSASVQVACITREAVDDELKGSVGEGDSRYLEALNGLLVTVPMVKGDLLDLSAGGVELLASRAMQVREGDYISLNADPTKVGVDLKNLVAQIVACEDYTVPDKTVLHLSFLPYPPERRRDIIQFVYKTPVPAGNAPPTLAPATPPPKSPGGASPVVPSP